MIRPSHKSNHSRTPSPGNHSNDEISNGNGNNANGVKIENDYNEALNNENASVKNDTKSENEADEKPKIPLKNILRKISWMKNNEKPPYPPRFMTLTLSKAIYPGVPHAWLSDGKLLHLLDSEHPGNYVIFQVNMIARYLF